MGKRQVSAPLQLNRTRANAKKRAVTAGMVALLLGALTWITGPMSRENAKAWLKTIVIGGALALTIRWAVAEPFKIPSGSMEPTLHGDPGFGRGDRVFVNKYIYGLRFPFNGCRIPFTKTVIQYANRRIFRWTEPKRFDIVVFKAAEREAEHRTLVKRVIGLPGERIHIARGKVFVNGEPLELPKDMPPVEYVSYTGTGQPFGYYGILEDDAFSVVPPDRYLVLGDNSAHSRDGRVFGWLPNENILGRVASIWWPIGRWCDFTGFSRTWWWRSLVALLAALTFVRLFLGRSWHVSDSAIVDFARGDHVYVHRCAFGVPIPFTRSRLYQGRGPRRGEIVLYYAPAGAAEAPPMLIGRVAGLPGEQVYLDGGRLQINGATITAPASLATKSFPSTDGGKFGRVKSKPFMLVPPNHYFILTDDATQSPDSRTLGWVSRHSLVGPATATWWPPRRWRRIRE